MKRLPRPVAALSYAAATTLALSGGFALATSAGAVTIDDGEAGYLTAEVASVPFDEVDLTPGDTRYWIIALNLDAEGEGDLTLEFEASGTLAENPAGLQLRLDQCTEPYTAAATPTCPGDEDDVIVGPVASINQSFIYDLGTIEPDAGPYFRVTLSLPSSVPDELQDTRGDLGFGFTADESSAVIVIPGDPDGDGDDGDPNNNGGLAITGVDLTGPLLLAAGLLLAGFVLARQRSGELREEVAS